MGLFDVVETVGGWIDEVGDWIDDPLGELGKVLTGGKDASPGVPMDWPTGMPPPGGPIIWGGVPQPPAPTPTTPGGGGFIQWPPAPSLSPGGAAVTIEGHLGDVGGSYTYQSGGAPGGGMAGPPGAVGPYTGPSIGMTPMGGQPKAPGGVYMGSLFHTTRCGFIRPNPVSAHQGPDGQWGFFVNAVPDGWKIRRSVKVTRGKLPHHHHPR